MSEQRYEAVMQVLRHDIPVTEVAARFGVSRQSVHNWIRRYQADGLAGLADRSHRPKDCPHQMVAEVEAKVCQLRRAHPGWGLQRLRHELQRRGITPLPSRSAVCRMLVRRGLIEPGRRANVITSAALGLEPPVLLGIPRVGHVRDWMMLSAEPGDRDAVVLADGVVGGRVGEGERQQA